MLHKFGRFLEVPEVLYNICNMCGRDLPDMSAGLMHTYQVNPSCRVTHITCTHILTVTQHDIMYT